MDESIVVSPQRIECRLDKGSLERAATLAFLLGDPRSAETRMIENYRNDPKAGVKRTNLALLARVQHRSEQADRLMAETLNSDDFGLFAIAVKTFEEDKAVAVIEERLKGARKSETDSLLRLLAQIKGDLAVILLRRYLQSADHATTAARSLLSLKDIDSVPQIIRLFESGVSIFCRDIFLSLTEFPTTDVNRLCTTLVDEWTADREILTAAVDFLGQNGATESLEPLIRALDRDIDPDLHTALQTAIAQIRTGRRPSDAGRISIVSHQPDAGAISSVDPS